MQTIDRRDSVDLIDIAGDIGGLYTIIFGLSFAIVSHFSEAMVYSLVARKAYKN
jgi:hypothetical protein